MALFKKIGSTIVYAQHNYPVSASGVDNTPYAQAIVAAKPNIVYLSTPFADVGPLASAIRAAGYKGIIMDFTNYIPGLLQSSSQLASALQGEYVNTQLVPSEQNTAYDQQIATQLGDIGQPKFVTEGAFFGYAEADLFIQQLEQVGSHPQHQDLRPEDQRQQLRLLHGVGRRSGQAGVARRSLSAGGLRVHRQGGGHQLPGGDSV